MDKSQLSTPLRKNSEVSQRSKRDEAVVEIEKVEGELSSLDDSYKRKLGELISQVTLLKNIDRQIDESRSSYNFFKYVSANEKLDERTTSETIQELLELPEAQDFLSAKHHSLLGKLS